MTTIKQYMCGEFTTGVMARSHQVLGLALAAMLRNGYNTHSFCSISVATNPNAWCEWTDNYNEKPIT